MSETGAKPGRRRIWKYLLWLMLAGTLCAGRPGAGTARRNLSAPWCATVSIATLERVTGGLSRTGQHPHPYPSTSRLKSAI